MSYTTYLRWGAIAAIFLVPFVLFIAPAPGLQVFGNMFFPYITGKNFAFRILVEIAALFYILLAIREPKYRPRSSAIMWTVGAFVAWMAIATFFSVDPHKSFWSNFERMEGYMALLHLAVWFVIASAVLSADKLWERFINTTIIASVVTGLFALFQVLHWFGMSPSSQSGMRADTTFGNATYLAVYMLVTFFLTLYMLLRRRHSVMWQMLYGITLVLQVMGLYFTETRGAILGAIGGLIVAAFWILIAARGHEWKGLRRVAIGWLALIALLVGGFLALRATFVTQTNTLGRLAQISLSDGTTVARFHIWNMARQGIMERPLTGWGQENFSYVFNKYYEPQMWSQEQWFDRAHNQFIDWFVNGGIPAGILYLALYVLIAWAILRSKTLSAPEQAVLAGLIAGFAFNNLFVFDNLVSGVYFFFLLAFFHAHIAREIPKRLVFTHPVGDHAMAVVAPIVFVAVAFLFWSANIPGIARAKNLVQAIQIQTATGQKDPAQSVSEFKAAFDPGVWPNNSMGVQEVNEQLVQYANQVDGSSGISADLKNTVTVFTDNQFSALLAQRKGDARLELFYGTFLVGAGQVQIGVERLKAALALSPQKQQIMFQLGLTLLQIGRVPEAMQYLKQAFDLAPEYDNARVLYAASFYYAGDTAKGDAILTEKFGSPIVDNDQLLRIFADTKQWTRAETIWKLRIEKEPKNVDLHLGLAQVYFAAGDKTNTITELQTISTLNPSVAGQMQQLIKQIQDGTLKP